MKKTYLKPTTEVIKIETNKILCGSGDRGVWDYDDAFGQVPGIDQSEDNLLA